MADDPMPFTEEELTAAATVPMTDAILLQALRIGTQALSEFGHTVMEPVFGSQLALTDRENAVGLTFDSPITSRRSAGRHASASSCAWIFIFSLRKGSQMTLRSSTGLRAQLVSVWPTRPSSFTMSTPRSKTQEMRRNAAS
jgi:hypothetical protein